MNIVKSAANRLRTAFLGSRFNIKVEKTKMIDHAFTQCSPAPKLFADLGGVWGVNGAYTFHALRHNPQQAYLVDTDFTDVVRKRAESFPNLKLVCGNFGSKS